LANLYDFDPRRDTVDEADLEEVDRYALARHRQLVSRVREAYASYEFHVVYHQLVQYCAVDLSSFYLDVLKDRLYCDPAGGRRRRSSQTVLHRILEDLARLMAPVLPFTADEVWPLVPGPRAESVHAAFFPAEEGADDLVLARWAALLDVRAAVTKALEEARAAKRIASSLEARVEIRGRAPVLAPLEAHEEKSSVFPGNLANLFIVSRVDLAVADALAVEVGRALGEKCERCWTYSEQVGRLPVHPGVCQRCAVILEGQ
jgi:isoleucyl-tRNA synthetase